MKNVPPILVILVMLALTACSTVTEQSMIDVIGNAGPLDTHINTQVPISTAIPEEPFTSVLLPVPQMWIYVPMTGAGTEWSADGSVVMMVFDTMQEAQAVAGDLHTEWSLPPLEVGDQAWMGVVSETRDINVYHLIIQRCQGVALVRMSKKGPMPTDSDQLRTYAQVLDSRMHAALCP